ncbi:MAG: hypothetical protein K0M54_02755 [Pseudomonas sp.]|nr:hypothetical protein [Pseudomonas sp.]
MFDENGGCRISSRLYPKPGSLGLRLVANGSGGHVSTSRALEFVPSLSALLIFSAMGLPKVCIPERLNSPFGTRQLPGG